MNALEIAKLVRQECGIAGADTPSSFENQTGEMKRVVDWVIQADMYIQSQEVDWRFLWSQFLVGTLDNTSKYSVPSDFDEWKPNTFFITDGNGEKSTLTVLQDFDKWRRENNYSAVGHGLPDTVIIRPDDDIVFSPIPDALYVVRASYYRSPTPLSKNDDEPPYPSRYHRLVVARAKRMYAVYEDAPEILTEAEDEFKMIWPRFEASQLTGQKGRFNADFAEDMVVTPE